MPDRTPIRRALISVHDKTGVAGLAADLHDAGVELIATGSTRAAITAAGTPALAVDEVTGFPECLGGRVKTLHPAIHAALLADRDDADHTSELNELGIAPIDLVVVNLYPFEEAVASGAGHAEIIEMIDIGGPTMLRAAAKNHAAVAVVVDPDDYGQVGEAAAAGGSTAQLRRRLATRAFAHVTRYDAAISSWFQASAPPGAAAAAGEGDAEEGGEQGYPPTIGLALTRHQQLRYGENPHQRAALYVPTVASAGWLGDATQLQGKELSYNNLVDTDAAMGMVVEFERPAVAIIKHTNPAGLAVADELADAHARALEGDPVSAFGGIVAANRPLDAATGEQIAEVFTEVVAAPAFEDGALEVLGDKSSLRLLQVEELAAGGGARGGPGGTVLRSVRGGMLLQDADTLRESVEDWEVVTEASPDEDTLQELAFAWIAAKHVKSNAIVLTSGRAIVGVGAGQMSRVDAVHLAVEKSRERHTGAVLASDAFFPFRDGPDVAARAGITAIVQPGGSIRDQEVIDAADEHGMAMVLTGTRHFRH